MNVPSQELARFSGLLASAVERGMPLAGAVELLAGQSGPGPFRRALEEAVRALREGVPLPDALARALPADYCALVRVGLDGPGLAPVLRATETYYGLLARAAWIVRRFALWLSLMGVLTAVACAGLVYSGSRFAEVYEAVKVPLPYLTLGVMWLSKHAGWAFLGLLFLAALSAGAFSGLRRSAWIASALYWIPGWGPVSKSRDLSRFCTLLSIRLRAGATLPEALDAVSAAIPNARVRKLLLELRDCAREGERLSNGLFYRSFFPRTLAWAVSLSEARGDLPDTLEAFGRLYASDLERAFDAFFALLTPLGIMGLGNLAAFFVVSFILPLVSLLEGIGMGGRRGGVDAGTLRTFFWTAVADGAFLAAIVAAYLLVGRRRARIQLFVEHLAALAARAMPIQAGLRMLGRDLGEVFGMRLDRVARAVEDGASLGEALEAVPEALPPLPRAMIALGERSGNLAGFLDETRRSYRRLLDASQRSTYVLLYPLFVSIVLNLSLSFVTLVVQPRLEDIFAQVKIVPPPAWGWTAVTLGNQVMIVATLAVAVFVFMGGASLHHGVPLLTAFRRLVDRVLVRLPFVGRLVRQGSVARLALTTGLFVRAGSPVPDAVGAAAAAEPNDVLRRGYEELARGTREGRPLSEAARRSGLFPADFVWFAGAGENSGALAEALLAAAAHFETRANFVARVASRSLVPVFAVLNGALVCGACVLVFLPLRNLIQGVGPW
jgi:type II secretory pathway component PulF